jgi:hypothetical protein
MFVPSLPWQIDHFEYKMASQKWRFPYLKQVFVPAASDGRVRRVCDSVVGDVIAHPAERNPSGVRALDAREVCDCVADDRGIPGCEQRHVS